MKLGVGVVVRDRRALSLEAEAGAPLLVGRDADVADDAHQRRPPLVPITRNEHLPRGARSDPDYPAEVIALRGTPEEIDARAAEVRDALKAGQLPT